MGLDWNPLGKPRAGQEQAFLACLGAITNPDKWPAGTSLPFVEADDADRVRQQFFAMQVTPYETLGAPRVGTHLAADIWIREKYDLAPNKPATVEEWVRSFQGYWVLALLPDNDGLPTYSNSSLGGQWERYSFRAQFFRDCETMLGPDLFEEAYLYHLPEQLADYGERLMHKAKDWAKAHDVGEEVLHERTLGDFEPRPDRPEEMAMYQSHIVASAARWAAFWSARGHGLDADW